MTLAANTKPRGQSSVYWLKPFHLTAQLSRFGVGAKNAAFYLGNVVTLESKPEGTKVHSVTLDKVLCSISAVFFFVSSLMPLLENPRGPKRGGNAT